MRSGGCDITILPEDLPYDIRPAVRAVTACLHDIDTLVFSVSL